MLSVLMLSSLLASVPVIQDVNAPQVLEDSFLSEGLPRSRSVLTQEVVQIESSQLDNRELALRIEQADGQTLELDLVVNESLFAPGFGRFKNGKKVQEKNNAVPLRGSVKGDPDSWARITFFNGRPEGLIFREGELEELRVREGLLSLAPSDLVLSGDNSGGVLCGGAKRPGSDGETLQSPEAKNDRPLLDVCYELDLGLILDHTFIQQHGSEDNASDRAIAIYNEAQAAFERDINVTFRISGIETMPTPGSSNLNPAGAVGISELLDELSEYTASGASELASSAGLTQLLTVRYQASGPQAVPVGLAFLGTTCASELGWSSAVVSDVGESAWIVAAHETGHNFNSPHDGQPGEACSDAPPSGFIMQPANGDVREFSACSKEVMNTQVSEVVDGLHRLRVPNCFHPCHGCGNGIVEEGEECDDRNFNDNDECRNDCTKPEPPPPSTTGPEDEGTEDDDADEDEGLEGQGEEDGSAGDGSDSDDSNVDTMEDSDNNTDEGDFGEAEDEEGGFSDGAEIGGGDFGESGESNGLVEDEGSSGAAGCRTSTQNGGRAPAILTFICLLLMAVRRRLFVLV